MLARQYRFHGHNALRAVYRQGRTVRAPLCSLRFLANPRRRTVRVAVVVSKKLHKSAVVRNRIRRRIYAALREQGIGKYLPYDLVFTVTDERIRYASEKDTNTTILRLLQVADIKKQAVDK